MSPELAHQLTALDPAVLGARIKAARVAAGLTQPELAGPDASVAYLSRIESGQRRAGTELLADPRRAAGRDRRVPRLGEGWEDAGRLELQLDHAELSLVGGEAGTALDLAREALGSPGLDGRHRRHHPRALRRGGRPRRPRRPAAVAGLPAAPQRRGPTPASGSRPPPPCAGSGASRASSSAPSPAPRPQLDSLPPTDARHRGGHPALGHPGRGPVHGRPRRGGRRALRPRDRRVRAAQLAGGPRLGVLERQHDPRPSPATWPRRSPLAKRALHLLENTERVRDLGRLRTQLGAIMLQHRPAPARGRQGAAADGRHRARLERGQPGRPGSQRPGAAPRPCSWRATSSERPRARPGRARRDRRRAAAHQRRGADPARPGRLEHGDREDAQDWYRRAITTLTGVGADREAAQVWFEIGTLAAQAGLVAESADAFRRAAASTGLTARLPVIKHARPAVVRRRTTPALDTPGRPRLRSSTPRPRPRRAPRPARGPAAGLTAAGVPCPPHRCGWCGIIDVA